MLSEMTKAAFFDELAKIAEAGGLMYADIEANSAVRDGPGVKSFARQKGYRKLALQIEKDAGLKTYSIKAVKALKDAKDKAEASARTVGIKVHQHPIGGKIAKGVQIAAGGPSSDASDMRLTAALQMGKKLLGG